MAVSIEELFGFSPSDHSDLAESARANGFCPFLAGPCSKLLRDQDKSGKQVSIPSGVCSLKPASGEPVICCPQRLYADDYHILLEVAKNAFGESVRLINGPRALQPEKDGCDVAVFGRGWGRELRLPSRRGIGSYFVDWILALIDSSGDLAEFVAVEVQTIDTTGNYREERLAYLDHRIPNKGSIAGFNWENVSKRILPQLIYKGNILMREPLCRKGLYFVCPRQIYERVVGRLGGNLARYPANNGSLSFRWYELGPTVEDGNHRALVFGGQFTTMVHEVANRFILPENLPDDLVFERAIRRALSG